DGFELRAGYDVRTRRAGPAAAATDDRRDTADHRDDRVEQRGSSSGSNAPGTAGFYSQAMGEQPAADHFAHADRFAPGVAAGVAAGSRKPHAARGIAADDDRGAGRDAAGARYYRANWAVGCARVDHRRAWNRQGSGGADLTCAFASGGDGDGDG